jgi:colanic acid/amylovoran biosynthesis glycosyltransferase
LSVGTQFSTAIKPLQSGNDSQNRLGGRGAGRFVDGFMSEPVVASYCTTFLKREMQHIYRQVAGLKRYRTFIITRSRENAEIYPFENVVALRKPRVFFLKRFVQKYLQGLDPLIYRGELGQLTSVFAEQPADLMHIYFGHTGVHLRYFIATWNKPVVVSFHGMDIMPRKEDPSYLTDMKSMLDAATLVLARSESLADRLAAMGCPREKIRINRTGIPLEAFPAIRREPPSDGAWRLVQAARLIEKKGIDDALQAFAGFRRKFPAAEFHLAGDGPLRGSLEKLAQSLGLADAVTFHGFCNQAQLSELFNRSHIFVHPSRTTSAQDQEGVPNAMLEAMATGLPVVATLHGGIPEAVTDGEDGLLGPERDAAALETALLRLANEDGLYRRLSENAAASVRRNFDSASRIAALEGFYDEARTMGAAERPSASR